MHRPSVEELITHLIRVHGCDEARSWVEVTQREAMVEVQQSGLTAFVPANADGSPKPVVVNLTEAVADRLFERRGDFEGLHDEHHRTEGRGPHDGRERD